MTDSLTAPLTEKQADVVRLIGEGFCYKQVAALLSLSIPTVIDHAKAAARKMPKSYLPVQARIIEYCNDRKAA